MSILTALPDRVRGWLLRGALKAATVPFPLVPEWARHTYLSPTYRALCTEGVRANGIVLACIETLAFAFPEPQLRVWQLDDSGKTPLPQHPLDKLLQRPNPQMGQAELLTYCILYQAIGGSCYLYKVRSAARRVVELWPLNDSQIRPIAGGDVLVDHYEWDDGQGQPHAIPYQDIIQVKWLPDPLNPWMGLPPLMAVARELDTDAAAGKYIFNLLKNDAIPRVVVLMQQGASAPRGDDKAQFDVQWQERYGGDNRGKVPLIMGGVLDVKTLSLNLEQLAFDALRRVPEARIAGAFRVPAVLAGLSVGLENATYANVEGLTRWFSDRTMVPLWRMFADEVGADLLPEFGGGDNLQVAFDTGAVKSLQEDQQLKRVWVQGAVGSGYLTRNEARAHLGLPPVANGDVFLLPLTIQEVPAALQAPGQKALTTPGGQKATTPDARAARRAMAVTLIAAQREQRTQVSKRMEPALDNWFGGLADKIVGRALRSRGKAGQRGEAKALPFADDLFGDGDAAELEMLFNRFALELVQLSWDTWNLSLGVNVAFDLTDPAVTKALALAGPHVKSINETTLKALQAALQYASERGWSIDHMVEGDATTDPPRPGLRDLIEQTYRGRVESIARTELGYAQQTAATARYAAAGVDRVLVMDNGFNDSAEQCVVLGNGGKGTVMSLAWASSHVLGHPRCVRAFAAFFPDDGEIDTTAEQRWQDAGGDSSAIGGPA